MWKQTKRVFQFLQHGFLLLLSIAVILVGYAMLSESFLDLHNARKYCGQITDRETGKFFVFTVAGAPISFKVYRASRNYEDIEAVLHVGDSATVYFANSRTAGFQVYQIEKAGQVIVGKELLEGQNRIGGIIAFIAGIAMLGGIGWAIKNKKSL